MADQGDWHLVRAVIDALAAYQRSTITELCEAAGINRTSLQALSKNNPVSDAVLHRLEAALGLPLGFLLQVAHYDWEAVEEANVDEGIVRFIKRKAAENKPDATNGGTRTA